LGKYEEGIAIYDKICKMPADKYAAAIEKALSNKELYTNNRVASLQQAGDFDGVIAMAEKLEAASPALAAKIRLEAYNGKKDYAKVIEIGEAAAALQTDDESKSAVYFNLGSAYNAKENKAKAIEFLNKVTVEPYATPAKAAVAELSK
jgi:tetratricopeptide (TPR) repeat protein